MELSTAPKKQITGRELLPMLQDATGFAALAAQLGGLPKGAMLLLRQGYTADTSSTSDADPGAGKLRWNNATQADATQLFIDDADADAGDHSALWATLLSGGYAYLHNPADLGCWQQWSITGVTDASGYLKLDVTLVASAGSFANDAAIELSLQQPNPSPGVDRNIVTALSISSGDVAVDCSLGDYFTLLHSANITGWTHTNVPPACTLMYKLVIDSAPKTVAWPSSWDWGEQGAPTLPTTAGKYLTIATTTFDGGTSYTASWKASS